MIIYCLDYRMAGVEYNSRLHEINVWLNNNIGYRASSHDWCWGAAFGTVFIKDEGMALIFKLKYGL